MRIGAAALVLWLGACAGLPAGIPPAPAGDPDAATLTLPGGRTVNVLPEALSYSGEATLRWPDGRTYQGNFEAGKPQGQGIETRPDGAIYRGSWQGGQRHGQGELRLANGDSYRGTFADGMRQGQGTLHSSQGVYTGAWQADMPDGPGVFDAADGARYEGEWRGGMRFGAGTYQAADGSRYDGDWAYDQPHGFGTLITPDGATYEGEWRDGTQAGYGRSEGPSGEVYEGTFVDGERHGFGHVSRPDGSRYQGEWQAGKRHGQGRETRADGSYHDGSWELNQALGPGTRQRPDGIEITGLWNADTASNGIVLLPSGEEFAGPLFGAHNRTVSDPLLAWLQAGAGRGDPYAQYLLGTIYLDFEDPPRDPAAARRWLGGAASAGIADAQFRLALTYEAVNPPRVVALLSEAAEQGHPGANQTLGEYYHGGITVPRNPHRAIHYYQRAVEGGSVIARNNLAWLLATTPDAGLRDGPRAVDLIAPIALYSGAWQYLDTLAAAWAAAGDFDQAASTAQQAIEAQRRQDGGADATPLEQRRARYLAGEIYIEDG